MASVNFTLTKIIFKDLGNYLTHSAFGVTVQLHDKG